MPITHDELASICRGVVDAVKERIEGVVGRLEALETRIARLEARPHDGADPASSSEPGAGGPG